jgi:hypothetical protein
LRYKIIGVPKNLKNCPFPYLGQELTIGCTCNQKPNLSSETIPLINGGDRAGFKISA